MRLGYARVSSKHQAETEALDQQINRLEKAGAEKILFDIESGRKDSRKQFNQVQALVKTGVVTEVIVTRLDRLGRTVVGIHRAIETFQKAKVKLTILDSPLGDTNSAFGWLSVNNIAGLAEFESRLLSERVRHGTEYYRSNLKYFGKPPFGYTKDENYKLIPHPEQWAIVTEIFRQLYQNSLYSISRWLLETHNIKMHPTTFKRLLHNPALRGHTFYGRRDNSKETQRHYNTHQALITEKQYEELTHICSQLDRKDPTKYNPHVLPGIFKCGACGYSMSQTRAGKQYQCGNYKQFGKVACNNSKTISKLIIKNAIATELTHHVTHILQVFKETNQQPEIDNTILDLQHRLSTLKTIAGNPTIDAAIIELEIQIKNHEFQQKTHDSNTEDELLAMAAFSHADFWETLSDLEFKLVSLRFIELVTFNGGREFSITFRASSFNLP